MKSGSELISITTPSGSSADSLAHWRSVFDKLGTTVWIWNTRTDEVEFTQDWLASLGYAPDQIKTGTEWFQLVHPDDRAQAMVEAEECISGKLDNYEQEFRLRKADGSYLWFMSRAQAFRVSSEEQEEDIVVIGIYTDTTNLKVTAEKIQTSEQRWVDALAGSGVGVWDWNLETDETYFSPEWINMLHYVDGDLEPTIESWRKVVLPEDLAASDRAIGRYLAGETEEYRCECRVKCKDGSIKWILDRGRIAARSASGKPTRIVGTHDDITEAKHREALVRETHAQLERITSHAPGVVYQGQLFPDGRACMPFASVGIRELFEVDSAEVAKNLIPLWKKIHPEDLLRVKSISKEMYETGLPCVFEYRITKNNGEVRWIRNEANPNKAKEPDKSRIWYGYISDVTDEKQYAEELGKQRDRLNRIANLIPGAVYEYIVHSDGSESIPFASEDVMSIFGESAAEVMVDPSKMWRHIAPEYVDNVAAGVKRTVETGADFDEEYQVVLPNKRSHWVRALATARKNSDGDTVFYAYAMDVSDRKRASLALQQHAEALRNANEDLEQFNYVAAHDLKEPLRSIRHLAEWIEEDLPVSLPDSVTMNLSRMRGRVEKLQALIDDLAAFSRAGRRNVETETIALRDFISSLVGDYDLQQGHFDISSVENITLDTSSIALSTVLRNLVSNAIAHHDKSNDIEIRISAARCGEIIDFSVADNGPGIAPEHHKRVFRMYQQLDPENNTEGTGSGLAIVKRIVDSVGRDIVIESDAGTRGTQFRFQWPNAWPEMLSASVD